MDDRLRIPQDHEYFHAVGLATIAFARLEWDAVWCCERLKPGYIRTIELQQKTAGIIGRNLKSLFSEVPDPDLRSRIQPYAVEFCEIVHQRNALLHARPGTTSDGEQRLFRHGSVWSLSDVNAFSDRCLRASLPLNALLYAEFKKAD